MSQGRIFPLVGPLLVLYLIAEVAASGEALDLGAMGLCVLALIVSAAPAWMLRGAPRPGVRRVTTLGVACGVVLVRAAMPSLSSLYLDLGASIGLPLAGALALHLALDTPDRPRALGHRWLRWLAWGGAVVASVGALLAEAPAMPVGGDVLIVPQRWTWAAPLYAGLAVAVAAVLRVARRRMGSAPEALASNGWATLGSTVAVAAGLSGLGLVRADALAPEVARGLWAASLVSLLAGHVAMLGARRQVHAGRSTRRLIAGALAVGVVSVLAALLVERLPSDPVAIGVGVAFCAVASAALYRLTFVAVRRLLAPFGGRLIEGTNEALRRAVGATDLEQLGAAILPPLRRASGALDADPYLLLVDPSREVRVDAASIAHVEPRELSPALLARLAEKPGEVVVAAPIAEQVVRRADLRPLADALERLDALCVVPLAVDFEVEGALVVPRGRRRAALTLEEIDRLETLGRHLGGQVAMLAQSERGRRRTRDAVVAREKLAEQLEHAQEELDKLRADTRILKAGGAAERFTEPAIAYSRPMRQLTQRVQEVGPVDAPVLLCGEEGTPLDRVGHLIHQAGGRRAGPFVVAECAAVRPERTEAALFGEAKVESPGWLRLAAGGTCLLLDVPALSLEAQAKLAEALATHRAPLADGTGSYLMEARIVATSRVPLGPLVAAGAFDAELHRRLEPLALEVPPLRERREDLPSLLLLALDRTCRVTGLPVLGIDAAAQEALVEHAWPGNLRELASVVDRAVAAAQGEKITLEDLPPLAPTEAADPWSGTYAEIEARALEAAMARADGNKSEAARLLGLKRTTFLDKLKRHDMGTPSRPPPPKTRRSKHPPEKGADSAA